MLPRVEFKLIVSRLVGTEMVDIYVGSGKEHFRVHKGLLCKKIPYFDKMFNGEFQEASTSTAVFPEDSRDSFDLLLGWIYSGKLRPLTHKKMEDGNQPTSWNVPDLYILAEKFCLLDLQDYVMDIYIKYLNDQKTLPSAKTTLKAYGGTLSGCKLRQLMVNSFRYKLSNTKTQVQNRWPIDDLHQLLIQSSDLAKDYLTLVRYSPKVEDPRNMPQCYYHSHDDKKCYLDRHG